jgi:hypothetical protein
VIAWVILAVSVFLAPAAVTLAGDRGSCTSALLEEEVLLPDGSLHSPGTLTICDSREYSPVSTLHATYMNGMPVGMMLSRRGTSEANSDGRPFVLLHRDSGGLLHLYGYAVPAGERMVTYKMQRYGRSSGHRVARNRGKLEAKPAPASMLVLAARVD